jgi:endonuclease G, mitochondrial
MARKSSSDSGGFIFKTGLFAILAGAAFWIFNQFSGKKDPDATDPKPQTELPAEKSPTSDTVEPTPVESTVSEDILPASGKGEIVSHDYFVLSYVEAHEQAEWVAYELNRDRLNENWAERPNTFRPDPKVSTESATPRDYSSSGYDKGHLCAAADMAFNDQAIDQTFFMSNMSPQVPAFNGGIWRELEELTRDWARRQQKIYVVTGPILPAVAKTQIGFSKVTVPEAYYKVIFAPEQMRTLAFIIPNQVSDQPMFKYACSIDKVEEMTGIDFFPKILKGSKEAFEAAFDPLSWPVNQARHKKRVAEWNE